MLGARHGGQQMVPARPRLRLVLLAVLGVAFSALATAIAAAAGAMPMVWPASGLVVGLLLVSSARWRVFWLASLGTWTFLAGLHIDVPGVQSSGIALGAVLAAVVTWSLLVRGRSEATLSDAGDISRLIGAVTAGALTAGGVTALVATASDVGSWWQDGLVVAGGKAAAMLVLLPLFVRPDRFEAPASALERLVQGVLTLGFTALVFSGVLAVPLMFAVLPMFAWYAYRGTPRDAIRVVVGVALIVAVTTELGIGPIAGLGPRYGLSEAAMHLVGQLFIIDCVLILLPITVVVAQQRRAAARAEAERATLERVVTSASGTAILAVDRSGRVTVFNPAAEKLWGLSASAVLGSPADDLWDHRERGRLGAVLGVGAELSQILAAFVVTENPERLWSFRHSDGTRHRVQISVSELVDANDAADGYLVVAQDVTEREQTQQALLDTLASQRAAVDRLEEIERTKNDFVATVSHELRTPITSILGYTEVLEDGLVGELSPDQREVVSRVDRNGRRLLGLVEDLLMLSHIESARLAITPCPADLVEVVVDARDRVTDALRGRRVELVTSLPRRPLVQHLDADQVSRMLLHLLDNAVKFTPDGGRIEIVVRAVQGGSEVVVRDTGIGIGEADQARLFTRFFRAAEAVERTIPGTGLGLTIANAIVRLHGGSIEVRSRCGEGTEVRVFLPSRCPNPRAALPSQPVVSLAE